MPRRDDPCIRPMHREDLVTVLHLERLAFSAPWTQEDFMAELAFPGAFCLIVAEKATDPPLAYLCSRFVMDGVEILKIAVHPAHRKKGFAARLMEALQARTLASENPRFFLEVSSANTAALAFYHRQGFIRTGVRKRYYPGGIDAITMMKNLQSNHDVF